MTVAFKAPLKSSTVNNAFVSKSADDIKNGKFTLAKPAEGNTIVSVQKSINEIFDTQGTTEGDVNAKVYATNNKITNGDNQKECIESFDAAIQSNEDGLNDHLVDTVAAHAASAVSYDDTTSGNGETDVQGAIDDNESRVQAIEDGRGAANGYASLDGSAKVPVAELPDAVLGGPKFVGTWDADTNTPDVSATSPSQGDYYRVSVAGSTNLGGITDWGVGDWAIYNGTAWDKIDNSESVTSVNGNTGAVVLDKTDIGLTNVTDDAQLKRSANDFNTFTNKTAADDADVLIMEDSNDSGNKKYIQVSQLLANAGGGGGGSFVWELNSEDASPVENYASGISVFDFDNQSDMEMYALVSVPDSYSAGDQINLIGAKFFSADNSGNVLFKCETQLLKTSQDMSALPLTGHTSTNTELTLTTANALTAIGDVDITDGSGEINSVAVAAGDILLIKFFRDNTNETSSASSDARFLKFSAGVSFV